MSAVVLDELERAIEQLERSNIHLLEEASAEATAEEDKVFFFSCIEENKALIVRKKAEASEMRKKLEQDQWDAGYL